MASGDTSHLPKHMTYAKSNLPFIGAFVDYIDTSLQYLIRQTFAQAEQLNAKSTRSTLSASFLALVCFTLGFACNVKFEVATYDEEQLPNDLHFVLLSKEDNLYIDDIDVSPISLERVPVPAMVRSGAARPGAPAGSHGRSPRVHHGCHQRHHQPAVYDRLLVTIFGRSAPVAGDHARSVRAVGAEAGRCGSLPLSPRGRDAMEQRGRTERRGSELRLLTSHSRRPCWRKYKIKDVRGGHVGEKKQI